MNIIFLSLWKINKIEEASIYNDLLRTFRDKGHKIYAVSPIEKRDNAETQLVDDNGVSILKVKIGNIFKTNIMEKGISTLLIENQYKRAIKKYFSEVKFDLVLYATPPITFLNVVKYIKERDNATSYLLLKDIFPQNAVDLNMFKENSLIHSFFKKKEKKLYEISDFIGTMSPANRDYILSNNPEIDPSTVEICPNTITPINIQISIEKKIRLRKKYNIPNDKILYIYGGNLGKPQGIDFLIECLKKNEQNTETFILIVGSGTEFNKIKTYFDTYKPQNSKLMNALPKDEYDTLANSADVGLIFLDHKFTIPNFPSRFLSYMQASLPTIAATDKNTDIGKIIEGNKIGFWNESTDIERFNDNLLKLSDKKLAKEYGENARKYLESNYNSDIAYNTIIKHLN